MPSEWQLHKASPVSWHSPTALNNLYYNADVPKPGHLEPNSALVRMRAAALNARDLMVMGHDPIYPGDHLEGLVPCADGSGEIVEVGEDSIWKIGDRVMVHLNAWIDQQEPPPIYQIKPLGADVVQGTLRQYAVFVCYTFFCSSSLHTRSYPLSAAPLLTFLPENDNQLIKAPDQLSFEEIASLPAAYGTSMNALFFGPVPLRPGMTVLTQGTGGCSIAAVQVRPFHS